MGKKVPMKKGYVLIVVLMGLIIAMPAYAVPIGYYPGLQELIDRADAIVILRIDRHLTDFQGNTFYSTHECSIYQTIKGNIPKNTRINLQLMNTEASFVTPYAHGSTHLMFLMKKATEDEPTEYRTLTFKGAQILLSPLGHEKAPEGKTIEQKIKKLIRDSIAYQAKEHENKQKFLKAMAVSGVRIDTDKLTEAVALAESAATERSLSSGDFILVSAKQMIIKGKYLWRVTFKASDLLPEDPSKGGMGAGGEIFVNVDLITKKTVVMYGE